MSDNTETPSKMKIGLVHSNCGEQITSAVRLIKMGRVAGHKSITVPECPVHGIVGINELTINVDFEMDKKEK